MNKFQKLAELNRDIELLESSGDYKSASILHNRFIRISETSVDPSIDPSVDPSVDLVPPSNYPYIKRPVIQSTPVNSKNSIEIFMESIEDILSGNSPYKFNQASKVFDKLMKNYPMPKDNNQKNIAKWEKTTDALTSRYQSLILKYRHNPRPDLAGTMNDVTAKSTPEQAKNSGILQAQYKAVSNSKKPRMERYRDLITIHQTAEKMWEQGKISRAGVQTFRDLLLKTEMLNVPYPIPGDPGFKPQKI